jgi:hypothetical protein
MPTNLSADYALVATAVKMKYKEPWTSEGLNRKLAVLLPHGIYRGLRLVTGGDGEVAIASDPVAGDHVAAVLQEHGQQLTVRIEGGDLTFNGLDDAGNIGKTFVIVLETDYQDPSAGLDTHAYIAAWENTTVGVSEWYTALTDAQRAAKVVLGYVEVTPPGGGATGVFNIFHTGRTDAWTAQAATGAVPWIPVLRNGGFEYAYDGTGDNDIANWSRTVNPTRLLTSVTDKHDGARALCFQASAAGTGTIAQQMMVPVTAGKLLRIEGWKKVTAVSAGGKVRLRLLFLNATFAGPLNVYEDIVLTDAVDADWVQFSLVVEVPAGKYFLETVELVASGLTVPADTVPTVYVDDLQVFAEVANILDPNDAGIRVLESLGLAVRYEFDPRYGAYMVWDDTEKALVLTPINSSDGASLNIPTSVNSTGQSAAANVPRFTADRKLVATAKKTLLFDAGPYGLGGSNRIRLYNRNMVGNADGGFELTINAVWDEAAGYTKDIDGHVALRLLMETAAADANILQIDYQAAGVAGPWADGAWSAIPLTASMKDLTVAGATSIAEWLGGVILGNGMMGDDVQALTPRVEANRSTTVGVHRTLLLQSSGAARREVARLYRCNSSDSAYSGESLEITFNAYWDGAVWKRDRAADSTRTVWNRRHYRVDRYEARQPDGWTEDQFRSEVDASGYALGSQVLLEPGNPLMTVGYTDTVTSKNIVKAWGALKITAGPVVELLDIDDPGLPAGLLFTGDSSFNAFISAGPDTLSFRICLHDPLATRFSGTIQIQEFAMADDLEMAEIAFSARKWVARQEAADSFLVRAYDGGGGVDFVGAHGLYNNLYLNFVVYGRQTGYG